MLKILKSGKIKFKIGKFEIEDYIQNNLIDFIEDVNLGLGNDKPILLRLEVSKNEFFIIPSLDETYILDLGSKKLIVEKIGIIDIINELYKDYSSQKQKILELEMSEILDEKKEFEEVFDMNLRILGIYLNKENFEYKKGNIIKKILESLNEALYLHSCSCLYDSLDDLEIFRIYSYEKTYLITIDKYKKPYKYDLIIIDSNITEIAKETYQELIPQKKMVSTLDLLNDLKHNLMEYGVKI